jgi:Fe-S oxidoreductase
MHVERGFRWFRDDLCDRCGNCFEECPVLALPPNAARADIEALIAGDLANSLAFGFCTTCNICDSLCPQTANPYELILESFHQYGTRHGLPFLAKMVLPNEPENIWSALRLLMEEDELSLLRQWERNLHTRKKEILLTGFYTNIVPHLAHATILDGLRPLIAGSEGLWGCAGDLNKLGAFDLVEQAIGLVRRQFAEMGVERVYCFMEAEAAMLAEILPLRFGADFKLEVLPLDYWILDRIERGDVRLDGKLNLKITVHDNCMSRYFGGRPQEVVRQIIQAAGCEIVEMAHNRSNALCCGWAATIPTLYGEGSGNPLRTLMYLLRSLYRRLREAEATHADAIVTSCPACYIFLTLIAELTNSRMEVYHPDGDGRAAPFEKQAPGLGYSRCRHTSHAQVGRVEGESKAIPPQANRLVQAGFSASTSVR